MGTEYVITVVSIFKSAFLSLFWTLLAHVVCMSGNFIAVGTVDPAIEIRLCYFMLFCFKNIYVLSLDFYLIQEGDELRPRVVLGGFL